MAIHEIEELVSNKETDTKVVLYLDYAVRRGFKSSVVRTSDADIFILLHYAHSIPITIYLDTGSRKHRQIINVSELSESKRADYYTALLGLYLFTGEDVTSAVGTLTSDSTKIELLLRKEKWPRDWRFHLSVFLRRRGAEKKSGGVRF